MRKKILGILMVGVLVVSLTGCGNNDKKEQGSNHDNSVNAETENKVKNKLSCSAKSDFYKEENTKSTVYYDFEWAEGKLNKYSMYYLIKFDDSKYSKEDVKKQYDTLKNWYENELGDYQVSQKDDYVLKIVFLKYTGFEETDSLETVKKVMTSDSFGATCE